MFDSNVAIPPFTIQTHASNECDQCTVAEGLEESPALQSSKADTPYKEYLGVLKVPVSLLDFKVTVHYMD